MRVIDRLLDETGIPVVTADQRGIITGINPPFEAAFGWKREDVEGRPITTLIPPKLRDAHNLGFSRYLMTGVPTLLETPLELEILTATGEVKVVEHLIFSEERNGQRQFAAKIVPHNRKES